MLLPPSLSTRCLIRPETKRVPRAQPRRETSMLRQTVSDHFEAKPGRISVAGRTAWAAGLWGGSKKERKLQGMAYVLLLVPESLPRLPQAAVPTTAEPRTTSCKFFCNVYCKSYFNESPLQSSSVLHIQHLLQNNVKNNWFTSSRQMATKSFSIFLYPIKLRLVSLRYIFCDIRSIIFIQKYLFLLRYQKHYYYTAVKKLL